MTLNRLSGELHVRGLALPNLGDIDVQSVAGALATGTHGTGARLPNLSAQVERLELVLGDGSERELTAADGDLLRAARIGLGALGVVAAVTLRCVPSFRLRGVDAPEPLEDVLASLDERADAADHFEFWTFPHSPLALTRTNTRTDAPREAPGRSRAWLEDVLVDNHVFGLFNRAGRRFPRAIPRPQPHRRPRRLAARAGRLVVPHLRQPAAGALHRDGVRGPARARRRGRPRSARDPRPPPGLVPDRAALRGRRRRPALTGARRDSAYVAVHLFEGMPWEAPFREVEALMSGFGGRPHWGKWSFLGADELAPRYPALGRLPGGARASSTRTAGSRTTGSGTCSVRGTPGPRRGRSAPWRRRGRRRDRGAARRSARTARPPWRGGTTRGRRPAGRAPSTRRLDLAGALLAVEPQAGRERRAGEAVAAGRARRRGSRRRARSPRRARGGARRAARRTRRDAA